MPDNAYRVDINPLNAELNPICHLLALLGGATIVVVSRLRVKSASLAAVSLKINECVIYFPPSFQRNTKKGIVLRVLEPRSHVFDNNIIFRGRY
jgi:hypothetical protein